MDKGITRAEKRERLPWVAWAWVVHGFLYAGTAICIILRLASYQGITGENLTLFLFLKKYLLSLVSILLFLGISTTLIVKPNVSGVLIFLGKVLGIVVTIVKVVVDMLTGNILMGIWDNIRPLLTEALKLVPKNQRVLAVVFGIILGLVCFAVLILVYVLICMGIGYVIHKQVEWSKHFAKS